MTEIILGLGSNLGNRENNLRQAVSLIGETLLDDIDQSSLHHSKPLLLPDSPPEWNKPFLNIVIAGTLKNKNTTPLQFLSKIKEIETQLGRKPVARWAPREIDIDILAWGNEKIDLPDLKIPHPEMLKRDFVLVPLAEIRPDWKP